MEKVLQDYKNDKIAVYGLSVLTETLLERLQNYRVIGLIDGYKINGFLYGKPILSIEKAIERGVRLIIIAARPESCKIIANRIGKLCKKEAIRLIDTHGNDLNAPKKDICNLADVSGITKRELCDLIESHDVISVDLFDTIVMRQTLFPTDVFDIVNLRLQAKGITFENFSKIRLEAEKELCNSSVPTLLEIYKYISQKQALTGVQPEELMRIEWETDCDLVVPRVKLCELLQMVHQKGKPVYIVSDTFYPRSWLAELLEKCNFTSYTDIMTSCEYRTSKTQQLFEKLRKKIPGKTCLHIGDSIDADIESAKRNGISPCLLYSGLDLFDKVGYLGLWGMFGSLSSRIQAGMLVSKLFNNPFQFEEPERKLHVDTAYDIGYLFFGPVVSGFVIWLYRKIHEEGLKNIWFGARDGYLIKKLYELIDPSTNSVYCLTSRFAAIRAGIENEEDICYVEGLRYCGSLQEHLWKRFGICVENDDKHHSLRDYKEEILQSAEISRQNYQKYLNSLQIEEGNIAFFDFVARGTVQLYMQRLTDRHLQGFYFWQFDTDYMKKNNLDVQTFYASDENTIEQYYLVLESVLMSPQPTVLGFNENGVAIFAQEERTEDDLWNLQQVQDGIADFFQTYLKLDQDWKKCKERSLEAAILSYISKVDIRDVGFLALKDEDIFFNRITRVKELL